SPERVARVGQRGEGPGWVDISQTFPGFGFAPLQPAKRDVAMSMDPANPSSSTGGWVPLRARVTDAGQPVAGAEVVFTLESSLPALGGDLTWSAREERTHAFTDENGWASAQLFVEEIDEPSDEQLRIAASYAGDTQRRTASAAQPFYLR
ncbi:MAG TPA: hypothetical protein VEA19_00005, partial [Actinomycetota bacterium]|nr:hypothetical protein [Actinomycetota bacterium]